MSGNGAKIDLKASPKAREESKPGITTSQRESLKEAGGTAMRVHADQGTVVAPNRMHVLQTSAFG